MVIHEVRVGYDGMFIRIVDWFLRELYFIKSFEKALKEHTNEEFKNLEMLI